MKGRTRSQTFASVLIRSGISNLANPLSAIAIAPALAHGLGVDGRGTVAAVMAPVALAGVAALLGIPETLTYAVARRRTENGTLLKRVALVLLAGGGAASLAVVLCAPVLSKNDPNTTHLLLLATCTITPGLLVGGLRGYAAGLHAWHLINCERYAAALLRAGPVLLLLAFEQLTPTTAIVVIAGAPVVAGLVYTGLLRGETASDAERLEVDEVHGHDMVRYSAQVWIGTISGVLLTRLDQTLMNPLASLRELGLYVVAVNVAEVALVINNGVRDVVFATESRAQDIPRALRVSRLSMLSCGSIALLIGVTLPSWISIAFGPDFRDAVVPAVILLIAGVIGVPGSIAGAMLNAAGRPGLRSVGVAVAVALNVVVLAVLVPRFGAVGAAVAMVVGNLVAANMNIIFVKGATGARFRSFYVVTATDLRAAGRAMTSHAHRAEEG